MNSRKPEDRFWEKVKLGEGCWVWTASVNAYGYGLFARQTTPSRCVLAHRYAYECLVGPIADDLCVLHRCDNPRCVRPNHLFLGTRTDNTNDKVAKGRARGPQGEAHPRCKLTAPRVRQLLADWKAGGVSKSELSRRYGISHRNVRNIIDGQTWRHLTSEA